MGHVIIQSETNSY